MVTSLVKPNRPVFTDLDGLAARVGAGGRFGVGGHHFARLPIALLRAVAARGVTGLRYTAWAGGLPLEILLEAEAVASADLCFSSLDIFGLPPRFRAAVESGALPLEDWTALAMIEALRAAATNMPSRSFQLPAGSAMMERMPTARRVADPLTGAPVGAVPPLVLDTLVLHAPRADESGNVEIYGARALDLAMVGAARTVLVTVDAIVPTGTLGARGRQTVILRNQVTAIAQHDGAAWPTSSLPHYVTDYAALAAAFSGAAPLADSLALPEGGVPAHLVAAAAIPPEAAAIAGALRPGADGLAAPAIVPAAAPASLDEIMVCRVAAELDDDSFASAGAVSPLANVAYRLAKATHAPGMIVATLSCGHLDIAPSPMVLSLIEGFDAATAAAHAGGDDTYAALYQAGAVTHEIVGAAQVDRFGRVNTLSIRKKNGGQIRLPGQGGMADVANMHRDYGLYVTRHSPLSLVAEVDIASSARGLIRPEERAAAGYRTGRALVFTDLAVFRLDAGTGLLVVAELMPGTTREALAAATGFPLIFDEDVRPVALPEPGTLETLRHTIDPLGLRRLEFVAARDRGALIGAILAADRALVDRLAAGPPHAQT
ncbi:CoA-transferase [Prosthecomicrobium pneumaticum]|uniref:Glutaconate CoA-transferase subunit A n=1 Tax=Prosthecomicrobium pneumaticum TaxID=81895 RepID=A0A7W9L2P3_9HYPH|nr:CoA-transferase [Prosthecomicrobium pneumaticum]MBB5753740.1 glutaconate CoA-transferase subunit A [Prosthecomicrobium pneumaticum]